MINNNCDEQGYMKVPAETYSRVVGYYRPVNQWNKGKRAEFMDRITYRVNAEDYQ